MWYMIKHPDGLVSTEEEPTSTTITTSAVNAMSKKSHKLRKEIEETRSKIAKVCLCACVQGFVCFSLVILFSIVGG